MQTIPDRKICIFVNLILQQVTGHLEANKPLQCKEGHQIFCKNFANITSNINNTYLTVGTKTIQPINCITCVTFTNHLGTHLIILLPVFI